MAEQVLNMQEALKGLPPVWPEDLLPAIRQKIERESDSLVVLDDDPTGTQTVHDVPVLTNWEVATLVEEFSKAPQLFYVLTNSRSVAQTEAVSLAREIGSNILAAARQTGRGFEVVSRSDSTLRGHFPAEVDALADAVGLEDATRIIVPFFDEGGRYTIGDVHYVREEEQLIPAAQTPFAKDAVFGYENSNLRQWVEEKTCGQIAASSVKSLSIEEIRVDGPDYVAQKLRDCAGGGVCIVNSADYRDIEVVVLGLLKAQGEDARFLFRTAASFVRVRAGLAPRPLVTVDEIVPGSGTGGLVVVGSHVPRSSEQLSHLLQNSNISGIELRVENILVSESRDREIANIVEFAEAALAKGQDVAVYTSRGLVVGNDDAGSLAIGRLISQALVEVVRSISLQPRYILAKGGITSSDIATQALNITRAKVLGQILPGVPVWRTGPKSKYPDMAYIVFPGNVGASDAISVVVQSFRGSGD